ncbi:MAG: PucR family transcriptional regulator, partial [Mycobacterium sp.]|nr:PucR family transcriptional regulator [Mycobacterium sp.]
MATRRGVGALDVDRCVQQIAVGLHPRLAELTADIQRCLQDEIPELRQDALTMELLGASVGGNVDTL